MMKKPRKSDGHEQQRLATRKRWGMRKLSKQMPPRIFLEPSSESVAACSRWKISLAIEAEILTPQKKIRLEWQGGARLAISKGEETFRKFKYWHLKIHACIEHWSRQRIWFCIYDATFRKNRCRMLQLLVDFFEGTDVHSSPRYVMWSISPYGNLYLTK